jgi:hypothetical protein
MERMSKPWFGPLPPVFAVFPITWQGWALVVVSQVVIALIRVLGPAFFTDPDKGWREASVVALLVEALYFVIIIWKARSLGRRDDGWSAD